MRQDNPRFFYGYIVVAVAFVILTVSFSALLCFGVFFKPLLAEFGWTRALTSGAFSLCMIMIGVAGIAMGILNDKVGPRVVLTLCGLLLGLGLLLMARITSIWHLYLLYGLMAGIGLSSFVPLTSTVARWFIQRRTFMTGIVVAGVGMGTVIGPPVSERLITVYDWRTSYIILGCAVLIIVIASAQFLRRDPSQKGQVPYGEHLENEQQKSSSNDFMLREAVITGQFWMIFTQFFCIGFCGFLITVHIVPHATDIGISTTSAATILALVGFLIVIGKVVMGRVGDIIGNKKAFIIGFILVFLSLLWLLFIRELWAFYLFAVVFGFGYGTHVSQQSPTIARMFGLAAHGSIYGVLGLGHTAGQAIGPATAGYIYDTTNAYTIAFVVAIILCITGLIVTTLGKTTLSKSPGRVID